MADNTYAPYGAKWLGGGGKTLELAWIAADGTTNTAAIFRDEFIELSSGQPRRLTATSGTAGVFGTAVAFTDSNHKPIAYLPAETAGYIGYIPAVKGDRFLMQSDGTLTAAAGENKACHVVFGTGNTSNGRSAMAIDASEVGTTATDPIRLLYVADELQGQSVYTSDTSAYKHWVVEILMVQTVA